MVRFYYRKENLGQHKAILEGIKFTNGKYIVTMDDDLQHNPVYIPLMFAKLEESNYDVIYARFRNQKHSLYRNYLSKLFRVFLRLVIPGLYPCYSSYRIIRRNMALKILDTSKLFSYPFIDGLITRVTRKINHIDASHFSAREINSTYSYTSLIKHAFMITINYSPIFNPKILFLKKVDEI
ncbi:MAG: glycosyltransferase family 2 protein [Bacteroidales bacterium]